MAFFRAFVACLSLLGLSSLALSSLAMSAPPVVPLW